MDETYIKVKERWMHIYSALDKQGNTIDFLLTKRRNTFAAHRLYAQTSKGLSNAISETQTAEGRTYALIIGISKYKNPGIPQLQFADKDANEFRNYLISNGVDSGNITLLTNEKALYADIMLDLNDLCTEKNKG